ncbi:alanyl-tRNA synthetase [Rhodoligotrophos appendicifer]|uniref:alanine--tRNA ligase n=1 Tax=Rhodoligotrophos appendicifer TaxID=987056 RepID=UPI001184B7D7|nr:alanine--tRNA ligase [Rhodoligotrophos appendicifer]
MTGVNEIRSRFLDFFRRNGHEVVASSPLVPRNDPTLMFTNSGMVQFKNVFTGIEKRPYSRATTSQKSVRAGGKHNDLDNVGYTARHHTFFEMLGNFSFGDYFKDQAIEFAWNLITREFGLNKDRLTVTVYSEDDEAHALWGKIAGLPDERIIRIPTSDNFWRMGDTGPCGPCSEIFYDHGPHIWGGPPGSPEEDGDRFVEIWNLVFMQFEEMGGGERVSLPRPSIDTGMGLERIAAVLQGTHDNYEIDLFRALIGACEEIVGREAEGDAKPSFRVIADHLRASSFLITDGVLPSNEGRGYVLRRIMRRAMRHAHLLGSEEPLLWRLVPALVREMGQAYPELVRGEAMITETLRLEESRFRTTLARGLRILEDETATLTEGQSLAGETAFKLYDTFGFPLDLTQDALRPRGIGVDTDGFNTAMERQRAEARKAWTGSGEAKTDTVWFGLRDRLGATEFLGYDTELAEGVVTAIIRDGVELATLEAGEEASLVLNQTPFYGESGGQVGDSGVIRGPGGVLFQVTETEKRLGDLFIHRGRLKSGTLTPGTAVELEVDHAVRAATRVHHSATHLVHEALRQVLGDHVAQKGSLVDPNRLRFDFAHQKPMSSDEILRAEAIANRVVDQNDPVSTRLMSVEEAIAEGARALFGEKYGDEVRVVAMGRNEGGRTPVFSLELCGGTHVNRTGDIGLIKIIAEQGSAAGVRRIEALAGAAARNYLAEQDRRLEELAALVKTRPADLIDRVRGLVEQNRKLERELNDARRKLAIIGAESIELPLGEASGAGIASDPEVNGIRLRARKIEGLDPKDLRSLIDDGKKQMGSGIIALVGISNEGKVGIAVGVTPDLTHRFNAVDLVRSGSEVLGGKGGGGRPDMAQAGGPDASRADEALQAIRERVEASA